MTNGLIVGCTEVKIGIGCENGAAAVGIKIEVRKAKVRGLGEVFLSRDLEGEGSRKWWEGGEKIGKEEVAEIRGWGGPGCTAG